MFVLINGAFGIGKSSVARELRQLLPQASIFNPEPTGVLLRRFSGRGHSDFQDIGLWRRLTVWGAVAFARFRPIVIIPMAFSNLSYLDEVRAGLARSGAPVHTSV